MSSFKVFLHEIGSFKQTFPSASGALSFCAAVKEVDLNVVTLMWHIHNVSSHWSFL